ncbi:methylosome subunit pICln isoform X2 [Atheta coriaria]|uniref:methylosome subunit pICln isoform X2 n=1 Tax=Dalotia coriaria TaxID=877792 RepID=UPI0031F442D0
MVVFTSFAMPESPVHLEQRNTKVVLDKREIGSGTLFVSERTLCWRDGEVGFSLSYANISLHAISNDANLYPSECIYIMIDQHVQMPGVNYEVPAAVSDEDSDAESEADISELILVPEDNTMIKLVYEAMRECQALNPDPADMDDEEDEIYEDADNEPISNDDAGAGVAQMVNEMNTMNVAYDYSNGDHNDEIFEDAD